MIRVVEAAHSTKCAAQPPSPPAPRTKIPRVRLNVRPPQEGEGKEGQEDAPMVVDEEHGVSSAIPVSVLINF
jgi:hypothetical protein